MIFYFNHNALVESGPEELKTRAKELKRLFEIAGKKKLFICESLHTHETIKDLHSKMSDYMGLFILLRQIDHISKKEGFDSIDVSHTVLNINNNINQLFRYCCQNNQDKVCSLSVESILTESEYELESTYRDSKLTLYNKIGSEDLESFFTHNPPCESVQEVFERASQKCADIEFSSKSSRTAKKREHFYRDFGYDILLDLFIVIEEILYPFYSGDIRGLTTDDIKKKFKEADKNHKTIGFSDESNSTMQKYGKQREVVIRGKQYKFRNHLKLPGGHRIYFKYIEEYGKIYIGYAGYHLDWVSDNS